MDPQESVRRTTTAQSDAVADEKAKLDVHTEEVQVARLTEDDVFNASRSALTMRSWTGVRICLIMFVMGCNQAGYGVDWAVISGINAFKPWHTYFPQVGTSGGTYGLLNALMNIGIVCGAPFLALADVIGRRGINFTGNLFVLMAALMQGLAPNLPCFMAGRFFLGFGSAMMSAPQYMAEVAPVHLRGRLVGIFGACFQIGSVVMNGVLLPLGKIETNWSWRIPLLLEALFPFIVVSTLWLWCPESPRYLIQQGKYDQAKRVIAKYQTTSGEVNQPIVNIVVAQIEESIENDRADRFRKFWDYRVFFTKVVRYRLLVLILYSVFQQWNGGGVISTFLVPALETVGITGTEQQLGINLGLTATYFVFTLFGSYIIDKYKRRHLIFAGLVSVIVMQTLSTITAWRYSIHATTATAALTVVWIFLFQILSSTFIATMHNLYPVEILSLTLRARGMGLYGIIQGGAGAVQSYGIGVGIAKLGYKIWVVYIIYNCVQLALSYFIFPETFGLTLEEIDSVFETKGVHPVKMSKNIQKIKKEQGQGLFAKKDSGNHTQHVEQHGTPEVQL